MTPFMGSPRSSTHIPQDFPVKINDEKINALKKALIDVV